MLLVEMCRGDASAVPNPKHEAQNWMNLIKYIRIRVKKKKIKIEKIVINKKEKLRLDTWGCIRTCEFNHSQSNPRISNNDRRCNVKIKQN